jgi:hypothetical protein
MNYNPPISVTELKAKFGKLKGIFLGNSRTLNGKTI